MSAMMQTLKVELGARSYPIHIGEGLLSRPDLVLPQVPAKQVMIVSNTTVAPLYLEQAKALFAGTGKTIATCVLDDGEEYKHLVELNKIFTALLENRFDRKCMLVALGGGVIGDMVGFAAAIYQRGVDFIQIPTTLLSQVDSSVGGKTGVNHELGKNMIGAFHQPKVVLIDTLTLNTLPDRELSAGVAEIIKYGLLCDSVLFDWLEANMEALLARDPAALAYAIARSCQDKADIVAADEKEADVRALLNLGHTFGHAIETGMGYGEWLHGEAVGAGMMMAGYMSKLIGNISDADLDRMADLISRASLPLYPPPQIKPAQFLDMMSVDKKADAGHIRLVLLKTIGTAYLTGQYDARALDRTLTEWNAYAGERD